MLFRSQLALHQQRHDLIGSAVKLQVVIHGSGAILDVYKRQAQTMTDPDNVDINAFLTLDLEMHAIWFCSMNKWYLSLIHI